MKTNFSKIDGRWVVKTGRTVELGWLGEDEELGDEMQDVCTGELFGLDRARNTLVPACPVAALLWQVSNRHPRKKDMRTDRIKGICGIHWVGAYEMKSIGRNRKLRRRMWPNATQRAEYDEYLPF